MPNGEKIFVLSEIHQEDVSKTVFSEDVLRLANNSSFLRIDHTDDSGKIILVFARGRVWIFTFGSRISILLDDTFKNCPRQFAQLYCLHVDLWSTSLESYIQPVMYALSPDKKKYIYHYLLTLLNSWWSFWPPKTIKVDFEAAVITTTNKPFQTTLLLAVISISASACGDKYRILFSTMEHKENEQVRRTCKLCTVLA